jgi:hypothetical protein
MPAKLRFSEVVMADVCYSGYNVIVFSAAILPHDHHASPLDHTPNYCLTAGCFLPKTPMHKNTLAVALCWLLLPARVRPAAADHHRR